MTMSAENRALLTKARDHMQDTLRNYASFIDRASDIVGLPAASRSKEQNAVLNNIMLRLANFMQNTFFTDITFPPSDIDDYTFENLRTEIGHLVYNTFRAESPDYVLFDNILGSLTDFKDAVESLLDVAQEIGFGTRDMMLESLDESWDDVKPAGFDALRYRELNTMKAGITATDPEEQREEFRNIMRATKSKQEIAAATKVKAAKKEKRSESLAGKKQNTH